MDFNRGDYVVHPNHGLGTVVTVEEMEFSGSKPCLFYRVDFPNTTVWVPVNVQKTGGLRPLTPKSDLDICRKILKSLPLQLEDDFRKRQSEIEGRMILGTFQSLCEVVRDLTARDREKSLNNYDMNILKQARNSLVQEWAAVNDMTVNDAEAEINDLLYQGKKKQA